ncbi:carnosine synthase 1-like [Gadus macrocephalus]|uniref:carnosine synthase 1-like n=1 Tax=Gadus macrocephalus TaxID=80720 RepID=UPI0028CB2CA5|nr:carnosine synthase 1-like [Gadus macrocephalus]
MLSHSHPSHPLQLSLSSLSRMAVPPPDAPPSLQSRHFNPPTYGLEQRLKQLLQQALRELNLPETQDLLPGVVHSDQCLCVLGSPLPYLSMLLEAGQRTQGDALLCLSPSWLSRSSSSSLLVHKAVTFDLGGRTFISSFSPPRKVTYFLSCDPYSNEEVTFETDCPIGSSGPLGRFWGDVLTSRVLLQKASLNTPPTLALLNPSADTPLEEGVVGAVELVLLGKTLKSNLDLIRNKVFSFLESKAVRHADKVVLRRSGGRFVDWAASSKPVYLSLDITEEVWAYVVKILPGLLPGEAAVLEGFCPPLKPQATLEVRTWEEYTGGPPPIPDLSFRLCAVVTRSPQDIPLIYKLVCRVGASDSPLSHHQSLCQSLETTLRACGFTDPMFAVSLRHLATKTALDCLRLVMETESDMSSEKRGGVNAQTDMIGVDLLFTSDGATIKPVVLGFHPSLCLHSSYPEQEWEIQPSDSEMEACRGTLLLTPFIRSQRYLMSGKTVLVIGAGGYSKSFIWEAARHYQLKIVLVDGDPNHFASKMVDHFFAVPEIADHQQDEQHCVLICDWLIASDLHPDGCVCFWDDCVILTSQICDKLRLRGPLPGAVAIAKEKSRTHLHLLSLTKAAGVLTASVELPSGQVDSQADGKDRYKPGMNGSEGETLRALAEFGARDYLTGSADTIESTCTHSLLVASPRFPAHASSPARDDPFHPCVPLLSPSPSSYAVPCLHVESVSDLNKAAARGLGRPGAAQNGAVRFPAVMKLEYGAGAVGVRKVESLAESVAHFERIGGDLKEETDHPGIGLGWGNAMTLMEYVGGTEHDIDVVIFNGQLEGAFVSDNGPARPPTFTETTAQMPSGLAPDKRGQLIRAAYHACLGCGLRDGVYNVELKMTELGPRLIEINARMGGFYLRNWILQLYGVDLVLAAFMVACGVRPRLPSALDLPAGGHFAGVMCVVSQHLQALRTTSSLTYLRSLHQEGAICLNELAAADELIAGEYEEPFCNVAIRDTCAERARQRLLALCQALGLHRPPHYDLTFFLSEFS